jgi:surface carbohydrate biosynthesis protein
LKRICLIVDNPLRDLDGLCLIAWHLVQSGCEVVLTPMYDQVYDVVALRPDLVLSNYARPNNFDLLRQYKNFGIGVVILDTEGVGEWWAKYARSLVKWKSNLFIDKYLCWGLDQNSLLQANSDVEPAKVITTGCPRYDFINPKWRGLLDATDVEAGYILINTNFPVVNPQFMNSSSDEIRSWAHTNEWVTMDSATAYGEAAREAFEEMLKTISKLCECFQSEQVVVRPHPFESIKPYEPLVEKHKNLIIRREGTSLKWIQGACALLHLNCFTALEAVFMGIPVIGLEWLNKDILRQDSSEPYKVSHNARSFQELCDWVKKIRKGKILSTDVNQDRYLSNLISNSYFILDGNAAKRVSKALIDELKNSTREKIPISIRFRNKFIACARYFLGYRLSNYLMELFILKSQKDARALKKIDIELVSKFFQRMEEVSGSPETVEVKYACAETENCRRHLISGNSIKITALPKSYECV